MKTNGMLIIGLLILGSLANAESLTGSQGLEKFKENAEASQKNRAEMEKSLQTVNLNVTEARKSREAAQIQNKAVSAELTKNNEALKKLAGQEKELTALMTKEKEKMNTEDKQLQQLQALIVSVQQNQAQRQRLLGDYQNQLNQLNSRKNEWKEREQKIKAQEAQSNASLKNFTAEEAAQLAKKNKYEKDLKYWQLEASQQQKIFDTYQGIAEGK